MSQDRRALNESQAQARIKELEGQVLLLTQQLDWLKRQMFGQKSERFDHPELFDSSDPGKGISSGDAAAPEDEEKAAPQVRPVRKRRIRSRRMPENLPVVEEEAAAPAEVLAQPDAWRKTSCETSDQLEMEPGYFYLRRTVRWRYVPVDQPFATPIMAPPRPRIIENGFLGSGLLSELLTNKYLYHLPFHRQHLLHFRRHGVKIPENTMHDAARKIGEQLGLLVTRMKERMLKGGVVCCDETPVRCLDRKAVKGSRQGYFWVYRGLTGDVIFDWLTSREHRHTVEWFGDEFEGILLSDAYQAYINYCKRRNRDKRKVRRAACLAHIRRKFEAALEERPDIVAWILKQIAALYQIENDLIEHRATDEIRLRVRRNISLPKIRLLGKAFKHLMTTVIRPKSRLGVALQYALGEWEAMNTFLEDGRVPIDNNHTERDIRPSALGKRNWMFIGHPEAGGGSAAIYSVLISAPNHGVDPQAYLKDVIERLPAMRLDELDALLPEVWAKANRAKHPAASLPVDKHAA